MTTQSQEDRSFSARTVLITGGASGIGQATAHAFARRGARVAILDCVEAEIIDKEVSQLKGYGVKAAGVSADISDANKVEGAVAALSAALGPIDTLINNAGVWVTNPVPESPLKLFDDHIDVNVKGTFYVTQACLPAMLDRGRGVIVNISSVSGTAGRGGDSAYSSSKAAVVMLTKTLAAELGPKGIRINCVAPGAVATPLTAALRTPEGESAIAELMVSHPGPNGRFFIDPEDIADIVLFLCSDVSKAIHGATIPADEGLTAVM